jgi:hypothetical protein
MFMEYIRRFLVIGGAFMVMCDSQNRIQALLGDLSVEEIETRRRAMFEDFIQASNTRLLFRDTIIESEYDPLVGRNYTLHYESKSLNDPCKAALVKVPLTCMVVAVLVPLPHPTRVRVRGACVCWC